MDDRVGDILLQRTALENGAGAAIFASILLHASLRGLAVWAAWRSAATPHPASVMTIRFAPAPRAEVVPAVTASAPPLAQPKSPPKTVPFSPFGKSTKKGSETLPPKLKPVPVAPQPAAVAPEIPIGGAAVTALEGGDFPYTIYIDRMKTLIGSRWFRPQAAAGPTTTVYFVIDRDGSIRDAKTETGSGNGTFDRAALRAVLESSPLPPLPFGYNGTYLGVHLTFR
jgi:TonB family protein